ACAVGTAERRGPPSPLDALLPLFIRSCEAAGENRTICDCVMTAGAKVDSDLPQTPWAGRDTLDGLSALDASIGGIVRSECGVTP
ncbi:MAG TPA: hypothetical protein VK092_06130, partial [Deinococcales bacterium]|nr:hypothetical protein [Deinococcales bacterium]